MTGDNDETDAGDPDAPDDPTGTPDPDESADTDGSAGPADGSDAPEDGERSVGGSTDGDAGPADTEPDGDDADSGGPAGASGSDDGDSAGGAGDADDASEADSADGSGGPGGSGGPDGPGGSGGPDGPGGPGGPGEGGPDEPYRRDVDPERVEYLASELADLQDEVDGLEEQVADKTVHRDDVEAELRRYVRARQRKGHATGWGPYLVLLYGVVMTLGAFYYLGGIWAILAMIIVWLSTLGLYVFMAIFSTGITVTRRVAALRNTVSRFRN